MRVLYGKLYSLRVFVFVCISLIFFPNNLFSQIKITDGNRNPKYNSKINPRYNSTINPKYNSDINPKYNSDINPKYNSSINPKYNSSINPKYNSGINPKYNSELNPSYNAAIDPTKSPWHGYYQFDLSGTPVGLLVRVSMTFLLIYTDDGQWIGYGVSNSDSGYNIFDLDGAWLGQHLESNSEGGFNLFTDDGDWINYVR